MAENDDAKKFAELFTKVIEDGKPTDDERAELDKLVKALGGKVEPHPNDDKKKCYWVCKRNNFMCDPASPPPNCECVKKCI